MFEKTLEIIFALTGALWLSISLITSFKSYAYVKKNLGSIAELLYGNSKYFKKLDLTNFFLIETTITIIAAARFRELKILKRDAVFSKGLFPLAPNLNDENLTTLLSNHRKWYDSVVKNITISAFCLLLLGSILLILK